MKQTAGWMPGLALGLAMLLTACASTTDQPDAPSEGASAALPSSTSVPGNQEASLPADPVPTPSTPPQQTPALELQGQISIKLQAFGHMPAKGISLGFFFSGHPEAGRLDLMTPLGSEVAQVSWTPTGAWLKRDGQQATATISSHTDDGLERYDSINELSTRLLGEAIPLQILVHWLQGRPAPEHASTIGPDAGLAEGTFSQDGWLIDTRESPRRLEAVRAADEHLRGIRLKVYLDH